MAHMPRNLAALAVLGTMGFTTLGTTATAFAAPSAGSSHALQSCDPQVVAIEQSIARESKVTTSDAKQLASALGDTPQADISKADFDFTTSLWGVYVGVNSQRGTAVTNPDGSVRYPATTTAAYTQLMGDIDNLLAAYGGSYTAPTGAPGKGTNSKTVDDKLASLSATIEGLLDARASGDTDAVDGASFELAVLGKELKSSLSAADKTRLTYEHNLPTTTCTVSTTLVDKADGDKYITTGTGTAEDTVHHTGWKVGDTYTVTGELYSKTTGKATGIKGTTTVTATSADGDVKVDFTVPKGAVDTYVATEQVSVAGVVVATHHDLDDKAQTIYRPDFGTTLTDKGSHVAKPGDTLVDTAPYQMLQGGHTYQMNGTLVDAKTGRSTGIKATTDFTTPTSGTGRTSVTFHLPTTITSSSLVATETLVDKATGKVVLTHADLKDKGETVGVVKTLTVRTEVDDWHTVTAQQVATANHVNANGLFSYRKDVVWNPKTGKVTSAPLWGKVSTWSIETLHVDVAADATPAQQLAAEKAAVAKLAGVQVGSNAKAVKGRTLHSAYLIGTGGWDNHTGWKQGPKTTAHVLVGSKLA